MFDFGFAELFVIIAAAVFLVGPKDIPNVLRSLGQGLRRLQYIRYSMSQQFEDFMREHDLNEIRHFSVDPLDDVDEKSADNHLTSNETPPLSSAEDTKEEEETKK